ITSFGYVLLRLKPRLAVPSSAPPDAHGRLGSDCDVLRADARRHTASCRSCWNMAEKPRGRRPVATSLIVYIGIGQGLAFFYLFLGCAIIKWNIEKIREKKPLRLALKLVVFNAAIF
ncbi:MAG: hypothetical protein ACLUHE_07780, partial [Christensenellales bacterium]